MYHCTLRQIVHCTESLDVVRSVGFSVIAWKKVESSVDIEAWLVKFQKEAKGLPGYLYEDSVVCGQELLKVWL